MPIKSGIPTPDTAWPPPTSFCFSQTMLQRAPVLFSVSYCSMGHASLPLSQRTLWAAGVAASLPKQAHWPWSQGASCTSPLLQMELLPQSLLNGKSLLPCGPPQSSRVLHQARSWCLFRKAKQGLMENTGLARTITPPLQLWGFDEVLHCLWVLMISCLKRVQYIHGRVIK